jgi:sulfide:quinone oxidoreductase|tara:strand:- start:229 stop:450 length:222 start_codon:yes stop_codon:yes gene_type:complete
VLGAGIGGLVTSNILKDKLGNQTNIKIVEQKRHFQFHPSYPWMMLGTRTPNQVQRNLDILKKEIDIIKENKQQ